MARSGRDLRQHFDRLKDSVQSGLNSLQQQQQQQRDYPSTLELQETVMSGWLRKLSSVLKSWQRKWFVIKGDYMYYYFSGSDLKPPQGVVFLPGSRIIEHAFRPNDSEKFVFDIVPRNCEGHNKVYGQEIITLSASSEEERTEWIRVIRRILYGSIGGAVFGKPLDEIMRYEILKDSSRKVPEIVESCVEYILENGIQEEGIFRLTGRSSVIKSFCEAYDCGLRPPVKDFEDMDVHSTSSILKLYLRELPSPLVPFEHYERFVRIVTRELPICAFDAMESLRVALDGLPRPNYDLLRYLCRFLNAVGRRHEENRMTFFNLATIFCTAFLRPELEKDACLLMATASSRKAVTHVLIEHQAWLFDGHGSAFDSVIRVEDLLGFEGNGTTIGRPDAENESKLKPSGKSFETGNRSGVVMRKSLVIEQDVSKSKAKQNNRTWLKAIKDGDSLEEIYCRWHSSHKNSSQEEAGDEQMADREQGTDDCLSVNSFELQDRARESSTSENSSASKSVLVETMETEKVFPITLLEKEMSIMTSNR